MGDMALISFAMADGSERQFTVREESEVWREWNKRIIQGRTVPSQMLVSKDAMLRSAGPFPIERDFVAHDEMPAGTEVIVSDDETEEDVTLRATSSGFVETSRKAWFS